MFCTHCGHELPDDARFCSQCGREVAVASPPTTEAPADEQAPEWGAPSAETSSATPSIGSRGPRFEGVPPVVPTPSELATRSLERPRGNLLVIDGTELELAGFGVRLGGFLIDFAIFFAALIVLGVIGEAAGSEEGDTVIGTIALLGTFGAVWIFNTLGWTPGKRAVGLRIVRDDAQPPGVGRGVVRTLGALISGGAIGIGYLWASWDDAKQTWHDKMASTYVVRAPRPEVTIVGPPR